jgi:hypothetical protein
MDLSSCFLPQRFGFPKERNENRLTLERLPSNEEAFGQIRTVMLGLLPYLDFHKIRLS